jgi:hypothetical protein
MVDVVSINIIGEIDEIFDFMQDMSKINLWSFGIKWDTTSNHEIIEGISNYDNSISYLKITSKKDMKQITYWIGKDKNNLTPRIYVYIIKTDKFYNNKLSVVAYRTQDMDNERWETLKKNHMNEVKIIKKLIEYQT